MTTGSVAEPPLWSIGDLNRRASRAVILDFRGQVWTEGELAHLIERRGSRWLELVERGGGRDGRDAHLGAFCSATKWKRLERRLAEAGVELRDGQRLRVLGCLDIGDRGKLTLTVDDVDVAALVGERVRARQRLVQHLVDDDLFDANRRLPLARLPLRIGLVASGGSDGHRDLMRQLESSGLAFRVTLRSVAVEGPTARRSIRDALRSMGPSDIDVAVIVRGGGAKASLDVFDSPMVAHAVATAGIPVFTGIGHAGDRTVADEVAYRSFPTPSSVGEALVAAVTSAWGEVAGAVARIGRLVDARLTATAAHAEGQRRTVSTLARSQLARHEQTSARSVDDLRRAAARCLDVGSGQLGTVAHAIRASGGAEIRNAHRRLDGLALDTVGAARRRCADALDELVATGGAATVAVARTLHGARSPVDAAGAALARTHLDVVLDQQSAMVAAAGRRAGRDVRRRLAADTDQAVSRRAVLEAYDPRRQLARGWTLTHTGDGRIVRGVGQLAVGDEMVTTFADGFAASTVTGATRRDEADGAP